MLIYLNSILLNQISHSKFILPVKKLPLYRNKKTCNSLFLKIHFRVSRYILIFSVFIAVVLSFFSLQSCKKPVVFSKGNLSFSVDTLVFDTVFTTIGSTTQSFKMYNNENRTVLVNEIELMGGTNSPFRVNVDGLPGTNFADIEVLPKDSLFVFVEVTLQVNNQNLPMIIEDSIRFRTNGKDQYVRLAVWGQDAYFHYADTVSGTWPNDKPHVVYNYTKIEPGTQLTIQQSTNVHFHKNSLIFVEGSLNVTGQKDQEVVFQGDRLEEFYEDVAGQWFGIYFGEAATSSIDYAIIKNGTSGIQMFSKNPSNPGYTLTLTNTIIQNNASYGILLYDGPKLKAENCVIAKNGVHSLFVLGGADYTLNHCTLVGYGSAQQTPAVAVRNYFNDDGVTYVANINEGKIVNSLIYGSLSSELVFDTLNPDNDLNLNYQFINCVIKKEQISTHSRFTNPIWNVNPQFKDIELYDFSIVSGNSPAVGSSLGGIYQLLTDIKGVFRQNPATIGAYEFQ